MSYHPPHSRPHSIAPSHNPSQSWGTSSSLTANGNLPPHTSTRSFKRSLDGANDATSIYSFGVPSHFSWSPSAESAQTARVLSPAIKTDGRSVGSLPPPSKYTHSATVPTTTASPSIFNDHVRHMTLSQGAYLPHPFLEPGGVWCDFVHPPSVIPGTANYNPNMNNAAFSPPLQRVTLYFFDNPRWSLPIAYNQDLTVFVILSEIFNYLQLSDSKDNSLVAYDKGDLRYQSRERNASSHSFHSGRRRIDMLGPRRIFYGLIPSEQDPKIWFVQLSERLE